jgi:hypothetical protein
LDKSLKILIAKDSMWHQATMAIVWKCDLHELVIHSNQLMWH